MWDDIKTHFEEWWIIYVWVGVIVGLLGWGVILCDGDTECLDKLSNAIR